MGLCSSPKVGLVVTFHGNVPDLPSNVDNPVAQKLLIKQLERYDIQVVATSNGEEAVAGMSSACTPEMKSHCCVQSGNHMFLVTLVLPYLTIVCIDVLYTFLDTKSSADMPICDGVEACKRIRVLENKRNNDIILPSKCDRVTQQTLTLMVFLSYRSECRLPRFDKAAVSQRGYEFVPEQAFEERFVSIMPCLCPMFDTEPPCR